MFIKQQAPGFPLNHGLQALVIGRQNISGGISKPKNFCLILGRGRTYNRKLFISRQACRKLLKTGLISGFQK